MADIGYGFRPYKNGTGAVEPFEYYDQYITTSIGQAFKMAAEGGVIPCDSGLPTYICMGNNVPELDEDEEEIGAAVPFIKVTEDMIFAHICDVAIQDFQKINIGATFALKQDGTALNFAAAGTGNAQIVGMEMLENVGEGSAAQTAEMKLLIRFTGAVS